MALGAPNRTTDPDDIVATDKSLLRGLLYTMLNGLGITATSPAPVTLTDNKISSATGSSQTLLEVNATRKSLSIINPKASTTDWGINPFGGVAVIGTAPTITLSPGDEWTPAKTPTNKITGIGTAASQLLVMEGN